MPTHINYKCSIAHSFSFEEHGFVSGDDTLRRSRTDFCAALQFAIAIPLISTIAPVLASTGQQMRRMESISHALTELHNSIIGTRVFVPGRKTHRLVQNLSYLLHAFIRFMGMPSKTGGLLRASKALSTSASISASTACGDSEANLGKDTITVFRFGSSASSSKQHSLVTRAQTNGDETDFSVVLHHLHCIDWVELEAASCEKVFVISCVNKD